MTHFEVIKSITTTWKDYGDMEILEIPEGCTHFIVENTEVDHGWYGDIEGIDVIINFGRYRND